MKNLIHSPEAEQACLGAVLIRPETLPAVGEIITPADFYTETHGKIFKAMLDIQAAGGPVDLTTVVLTLKERGQLDAVGGPVFLANLSQQVGFAANVEYYARAVAKKADRRHKKELAQRIIKACDNGGAGLTQLCSAINTTRGQRSAYIPISADELVKKQFEPQRWAVPGKIPEGLTILGGRPKTYKSWLTLDIAVAKASGGKILSKIDVEQGEVLYLALEDPQRRLKERLEKINPHGELPKSLYFLNEFPPLYQGGLDFLDTWLKDHHQAQLIVIDTYARIKPPRPRNIDPYEHDSQVMASLQKLCITHKISIILVHHTKKSMEDDFLSNILGSSGTTGTADCVAELTRKSRGDINGTLKLTGRDILEQELAMRFDADLCLWQILGDAKEYSKSQERAEIISILKKQGPLTAMELSEIIVKNVATIRKTLGRMKDSREVKLIEGNKYMVS
jgi:hypothetical protein